MRTPLLPRGACRYCRQPNSYSSFSCHLCAARLPWTLPGARTFGDRCPSCTWPNRYLDARCVACGEELPWAEAAELSRAVLRRAESDEMAPTWVVAGLSVATMMFLGLLLPLLPQ